MIQGLDHLHITCGDVAAAAKYFQEIFDAQETSREEIRGLAVIRMTIQGTNITLMGTPNEVGQFTVGRGMRGLDHFCFLVKDLEGTVEAMKKKGATFSVEPGLRPNGAKIAFVDGPEGIHIELKEWA